MSFRRLIFVSSDRDLPPFEDQTGVVVLDTAWTPPTDARLDLLAIRPLISSVVERMDLFDDSLHRLDEWAAAAGIADRMMIDGLSWWFPRRTYALKWLQYRTLWAWVLSDLMAAHEIERADLLADEPALADVLGLVLGDRVEVTHARGPAEAVAEAVLDPDAEPELGARTPDEIAAETSTAVQPPRTTRGLLVALRTYLTERRRRQRRRERLARTAEVAHRFADAAAGGRILVLTSNRTMQTMRVGGHDRRADPFLASIIERLDAESCHPVMLGFGMDWRRAGDWRVLAANPLLIPDAVITERYRGKPLEDGIRHAREAAIRAVAEIPTVPLVVAGVDLGPALVATIRDFVARGLASSVRARARAEAFIAEIRPSALVLVNEYSRAGWVAAADKAGIPVFAIQHGVIYRSHPGYRHPRHPGIPYPRRMFVFGSYEARILRDVGEYRDDEVVVAGSPRLDLAQAPRELRKPGTRTTVRRDLGVADGDRLLVISTAWEELQRRAFLVPALGRLLDEPLPNVHLVFKQHPAETDDGPYRQLIEGLARAGGFTPPRTSVVRDVDLYRLLAAADAHLGLYSTVLTDAVVAGTPNIIALTQVHRDLLGYVEAGVATPVASAAQLRAAIDAAKPPDEAARQAFLADHFASGDASRRIVTAIRSVLDLPGSAPG